MPVRLSVPLVAATVATLADGMIPAGRVQFRRPIELPNPYLSPMACGLEAPGAICDPDGVLSPDGRLRVANVLDATRNTTSVHCPDGTDRGIEVGFAVVRHMDPREVWNDNVEAAAERFATEVGEAWGVGAAGCDNGVVLFMSIGDRVAHIKTAPTSRQVLSDATAVAIVDNMKPLLRKKQYDEAVLQAALQIHDVLHGESIPGVENDSVAWISLAVIGALVCCRCAPLVAILVTAFLRCFLMPCAYFLDGISALRGVGARRRAERDLARVQEEVGRSEFEQTMCPICLEDFSASTMAVVPLDCAHRFHRDCVSAWTDRHVTCPLCRADISSPIAPEDESRPQEYQRRLRWYLSRLQHRHPRAFPTAATGSVPFYAYGMDGRWTRQSARSSEERSTELATYSGRLQSRYEGVMRGSRGALRQSLAAGSSRASGSSRGFGGGGGFRSGGGGGGRW